MRRMFLQIEKDLIIAKKNKPGKSETPSALVMCAKHKNKNTFYFISSHI